MLTNAEIEAVRDSLSDILSLNGGRVYFGQIFAGPEFPKALNALAPQFAGDDAVAAAAVKVCMQREWTDKPTCWMETLLRAIRNNNGAGGARTVADVDQIVARIQAGVNILDEVWYHHWVRNQAPFVGRSGFRLAMIRELSRTGGRPILRLEGDTKTGKTYSRELLEYVSEKSGWSFQVIYLEVTEATAFTMNSVKLTQRIVSAMGSSPALIESGEANPSQDDMQVLLDWIWRVASGPGNGGKQRWLFLDGFRFLHAQNTARKLVQALAEQIANGNYRQWLRLILSDFDEPLSRVDEETRVAYDRPGVTSVDAAAVRECLRQLSAMGQKTPDEQELLARAQAIVSVLPKETYFQDLYKVLVRARSEMLANAG